jgi:iron-sulfur cluster assembly protein
MLYVAGTRIDWREAVFGSQFEITNPNASGGCGCGESFSV